MKYLYIILSIILLASCDGTIESGGSKHKTSTASFNLVKKNIDDLGQKPWDKKAYTNIRENQIPKLKRQSEKQAASKHLETTYGKVLVRDARKILDGGCAGNYSHTKLSQLFAELNGFKKTAGYTDVAKLKQEHDRVLKYASSGIANQSVTSYRDRYDSSYENSKMSEAKSYLAKSSVKCTITRKKLQHLASPSAYNGRRARYCALIVKCYLQCTNPAKSELNEALGKLNVYNGSSSQKEAWRQSMREHYESIQLK